ncbi:MAG TPA: hypothetical protein VFL77_08985 [Solirubrobacterales bacterium]|nr:hypothetical protein [Solirubrobacterales bacterium]
MRFAAASLLACLAVAAGGCGNQGESTPVACLEGAAAYEKALQGAPGEVLLGGETPIGDCLATNQQPGDLARVGEAMIDAATTLNTKGREGDHRAALELGYLVGAARRGAADSEGIHSDLLRRLTVAARYAPAEQPLPPAFFRAYRTGYAAGQSNG